MLACSKTFLDWLVAGGVAGLAAAGIDALVLEQDLRHGLLPIVAAFAWTLRAGVADARVPDLFARARAPRGPNVLLVVMDTVRADRLSSYGYGRATTPELDAFAREAIRYPSFWSTAPWTLPGHASLFTGAYPMRHGATQEHLALAPRFATLAEVLRNAGWATFAASANPIVSRAAGLDQGFASFVEAWRSDGASTTAGSSPHPATSAFARFPGTQPELPMPSRSSASRLRIISLRK